MNYEKVQKYLKSLQTAGITNCDLNGYQNYVNAKLHRQRSMAERSMAERSMVERTHQQPHHHHHHRQTLNGMYPTQPHYPMPIYAPASASSGYMANARLYTLPHSYQSNFYQDYYYENQDERKSPREVEKRRKKSTVDDANLSYTGVDRDLADSYLKSIEAKDHHNM